MAQAHDHCLEGHSLRHLLLGFLHAGIFFPHHRAGVVVGRGKIAALTGPQSCENLLLVDAIKRAAGSIRAFLPLDFHQQAGIHERD